MTREDFIKGVKEGTIADYEMIRYCEEDIIPYANSIEEKKEFLKDIIGCLLVEYLTTDNKRLNEAYHLINNHYENPMDDPCYNKVIVWQDGHIVLKEKEQQPESEQGSKKHATKSGHKKKAGRRPAKGFDDCIVCGGDETLKQKIKDVIKKLSDEKKGVDFVNVIQAAMQAGMMTRPTYNAVQKEFGDIGSGQNYYKCIGETPINGNIQPYINILTQIKNEHEKEQH